MKCFQRQCFAGSVLQLINLMFSRIFYVMGALCLLPVSLTAGEPSRGTVIMVSSIGGWVLFSSGSIALREMRRSRQKAETDTAERKQPKG
jgi:hypothetical protein